MSSKPHLAYKDSGVSWLGAVPETWSVERIKARARLRTEKAVDADRKVALENIESWTGRFTAVPDAQYEGDGVHFSLGDVLFGKLRPYLAKAWLADSEGAAVGDFHVFALRPGTESRFFLYVLLSREFISLVDGSTYGAKMPRASWDFIGNVVGAFPSSNEQSAIAYYLDRETAKIDALVEKQERLIERLAERRQAVVSHFVTKGLNPSVSMKGSGAEWLGQVPAAWQLGHLRWYATCVSGKSIDAAPERDERNPYPALGGNGLMGYAAETNTSAGTLVVGRVGALCGNVHPVAQPSWVTDNALYIVPGTRLHPEYLLNVLRARRLHDIASKTAQPLITGAQLLDQTVPIPPISDQKAIVEHISEAVERIHALTAKASEMIIVLKERRQALISAAVTGKIDVRGLSDG